MKSHNNNRHITYLKNFGTTRKEKKKEENPIRCIGSGTHSSRPRGPILPSLIMKPIGPLDQE